MVNQPSLDSLRSWLGQSLLMGESPFECKGLSECSGELSCWVDCCRTPGTLVSFPEVRPARKIIFTKEFQPSSYLAAGVLQAK